MPSDRIVAAVVLDSLAAPQDPELDRAVGPGAAQRLRRELRAVARRWVAATAPGLAFEATSPAAALMGLGDHAGPVVVVAPDVPGLGAWHRRALVEDLAAGAQMVVGATHDGRPYLLGLATGDPDLLAHAGDQWDDLMVVAAEHELHVAMLRSERRLVSPADVRAMALDPLAPPELLAQLGWMRPRRGSDQ